MTFEAQRRQLLSPTWLRLVVVTTIFSIGLVSSGCITSRVALPRELPVQPAVPTPELVSRIATLQQITQLKSSVGLQFADYKESDQGKGKIYPTADGKLVLQRPQRIRLAVDATLVGKIADMGSDGEQFTVAVFYPTDKRSFIRGTNLRKYTQQVNQLNSSTSTKDISTFSKLRPQHLALPMLVPALPEASPDTSFFVVESRQDEAEVISRDGQMSLEVPAKRVMRTYYVLYVSHRSADGQWVPIYSYWFDRTRKGTPLVRLQIYEEDGTLSTQSEYEGYADKSGRPQLLPQTVKISRPHDGYAVRITFREPEINSDPLSADVFMLQNDENLQVLDLDTEPNSAIRAKASEN